MQTSRAVALGITAALVIGCGVVVGVLMHQLTVTVLEGGTEYQLGHDDKYSSFKKIEAGPVWTLGLVYIIPGVLAFIAAFVQNKCLYICSCVISMLAILLMGLIIIFIGLPVFFILVIFAAINKDCTTAVDACRCRADNMEYETMPFKSCDYLTDFTYLGIGLAVVIVVAWIFLLSAFIIACIYACRSKRQAGVVFTPAQQPMLKGDEQPM